MESFNFETEQKSKRINSTVFNGSIFYNVYKDAEFLRIDSNIEKILARGYLIRQKVNSLPVGDSFIMEGMNLERNTPLILRRAGRGVTVEDFEFTYNRLAGLVAAFAYENRIRFPSIEYSEAKTLGLVWDHNNKDKCQLYLSAVSGTEHMIDQFSYLPLICAIRMYQLKKKPVDFVVSMGLVKNNEGITMWKLLKQNIITTKRFWLMFPNASLHELEQVLTETQFKKFF